MILRRRHPATACCAVAAVAVAVLAGCGSSGGHPQHRPSGAAEAAYGSLPTFLPSSTVVPDSVLTGDAARPALTTEGDAVDVHLAGGGTLRASVSGPVVPGEGLPVQTEATTCTWTITLSRATRRVPVVLADFTTLDHLGGVYRPKPVPGAVAPPAVLLPGRTATFELRAVMPTGEGLMRWAPDGSHVVASWDFEVEND